MMAFLQMIQFVAFVVAVSAASKEEPMSDGNPSSSFTVNSNTYGNLRRYSNYLKLDLLEFTSQREPSSFRFLSNGAIQEVSSDQCFDLVNGDQVILTSNCDGSGATTWKIGESNKLLIHKEKESCISPWINNHEPQNISYIAGLSPCAQYNQFIIKLDIDECLNPASCPNGKCTNTFGSFSCTCNEGYTDNRGTCVDADECLQRNICPPNSVCKNLPGLYRCDCNTGLSGSNCIDIDECLNPASCSNGKCTNYFGSFSCICNEGYTDNGGTCADTDECSQHNICPANSVCKNLSGLYRCDCNTGFSGPNCTDILPGPNSKSVNIVLIIILTVVSVFLVLIFLVVFLKKLRSSLVKKNKQNENGVGLPQVTLEQLQEQVQEPMGIFNLAAEAGNTVLTVVGRQNGSDCPSSEYVDVIGHQESQKSDSHQQNPNPSFIEAAYTELTIMDQQKENDYQQLQYIDVSSYQQTQVQTANIENPYASPDIYEYPYSS